ncbi:MAG: hypothetical protein LBP79_06235 [Clostridiales bacterium]|jgi:hypothetical protein|nr:hypothetical protein [Clostridiales bacterium]
MNGIETIKVKATALRALKVLAYLTGLPLLLFAVHGDAAVLEGFGVTAQSATNAFKVLLACFAAVAAVQLAVGFAMKKCGVMPRALIAAVAAAAAVIAPLAYTEGAVRAEFAKLEAKYAAEGYGFARYEIQISDYAERAAGHERALGEFMSRYNLSGTDGELKGGNLDGTPTASASGNIFLNGFGGLAHYAFGGETGAVYSMNGLYADGYIFGYKQAEYILTTYYNIFNEYKARGLDADAELKKALEALDAEDSLWSAYRKTEEYLRGYGDSAVDENEKIEIGGGEYALYKLRADRYYLTLDEVKEMVDKLFAELSENEAMAELAALIKGANGLLSLDLPQAVIDLFDDYKNIGYAELMDALAALNIETDGGTLNEETLLGLISDYSFYQAPSSYPKMFFIEDAALRDYAYAKYLGTKHGQTVGSVLIGGGVGEVTLDGASGNSPMSETQVISLFKRIEIESEFMPKYYPWLAARDALVRLGGLAPLAMIIAYLLAYAERKQTDKITVKEGRTV